jgi:hypothetical protein
MHQYNLGLPADVRVNRHEEDELVIFTVRKIELVRTESFHDMWVDETVLRSSKS